MKIDYAMFKGVAPIIDPRSIKPEYGMLSHNTDIDSGKLVPFMYGGGSGSPCGTWRNGSYDYVESPLKEDAQILKFHAGNDERIVCDKYNLYIPKPQGSIRVTVKKPLDINSLSSLSSNFSFVPGWGNVTAQLSSASVNGSILTLNFYCNGGQLNVRRASDFDSTTTKVVYPHGFGTLIINNPSDQSSRAISFNFNTKHGGYDEVEITSKTGDRYAGIAIESAYGYGTNTYAPLDPPDGYKIGAIYNSGYVAIKLLVRFESQAFARYYAYSVVPYDDIGWESPMSDPSDIVYCRVGDEVEIIAPTNSRIYRTAGAVKDDSASFYFVKDFTDDRTSTEISAGATAYTVDEVLSNELGEEHLDVQNPPEEVRALNIIGGALVAATEYGVWFSEPYIFFDWDIAYQHTVESEIVGLACSGNCVFVLTKGYPELLKGTHPATMSQQKSTDRQPCLSRKSIVSVDGAIYYVSSDGLVLISESGGCVVVTKGIISKEQWEALSPAEMVCGVMDSKIAISTPTCVLLYDTINKTLTTHSGEVADDAYTDADGNLCNVEIGGDELTWRSNIVSFDRPVSFSAARVSLDMHDDVDCTLNIYSVKGATYSDNDITHTPCNAVLVCEMDVTSNKAFRLPVMRREREWFFEIISNTKVNSVEIATSMSDLYYNRTVEVEQK